MRKYIALELYHHVGHKTNEACHRLGQRISDCADERVDLNFCCFGLQKRDLSTCKCKQIPDKTYCYRTVKINSRTGDKVLVFIGLGKNHDFK